MSPLLLLILDGWGVAPDSASNAITQAHTPQWDKWLHEGTHTLLEASGHKVGLPDSQMGNSEVGHMHIGAGRVIKQSLSQINEAIQNGQILKNEPLIQAIEHAKTRQANIHVMGLLSDGGVHSHQNHLFALLTLMTQQKVENCFIHAFLDGRDTSPKSAKHYLKTLEKQLNKHPFARLASISGRYYAMDRDQRWNRTEQMYDMLTHSSHSQMDALNIVTRAYNENLTDEFILPTPTLSHQPIKSDDLVIFFNFRSDRARQLSYALTDKHFTGFKRKTNPPIHLLTMTNYAKHLNAQVAFPANALKNTLGECLQNANLSQLRISETEKYAHVTFFFNGGKETIYTGEDRTLVPSPHVETYDLRPEMSANEITSHLITSIEAHKYDVIICNFANADMVGHTGNFQATIKAIETLDHCFEQIDHAIKATHANLLITADHGNAEKMFDAQSSQQHTAHTESPVPFLHIGEKAHICKQNGSLTDIAPTVLYLLNISLPPEMTGETLLKRYD